METHVVALGLEPVHRVLGPDRAVARVGDEASVGVITASDRRGWLTRRDEGGSDTHCRASICSPMGVVLLAPVTLQLKPFMYTTSISQEWASCFHPGLSLTLLLATVILAQKRRQPPLHIVRISHSRSASRTTRRHSCRPNMRACLPELGTPC